MHPFYVPIDPETLKRLYVEGQLTAKEVARRLGCAPNTVLRRLRAFGIPARPQGPRPSNPDALSTRRCLRLTNSITQYTDSRCYHIQWRDRRLYTWLVAIGLAPAKSLTLGPLKIPDEYFADFFRGCLDGDGTVLVYKDQYHVAKKESYVYDRLYVSLYSASLPFLNWVRARICTILGVSGAISEGREQGRACWRLRYAKAESIRVLGWIYYATDVPCLFRKRVKAERYLSPLGHSPSRPRGRPRVGWLYNTVIADRAGVAELAIRVALKTPCPQGRAGSTPAPGTIP